MTDIEQIAATRRSRTHRRGVVALLASVAIGGIAVAAPPERPGPPMHSPATITLPEYRIGAGDDLSVTFPYNAELNHDGPVGPDGRFTMPLLGNLPVAGKTIDETTAMLTLALRRQGIVENAFPSVTIRTYGATVFVGGEVRLPGAVKMVSSMDPLQAVIVAGGLLDSAKSKQVVVIHRNDDGTIVQRYADLRAYAHHGVPAGPALQPQDIVFVPRSSIAEADLWVDQHINKLLPFSRSLNYSLGGAAINTVAGR